MIIKTNKDGHYEVIINHVVVIGKENPIEHFHQYATDLIKKFDIELTKHIHQVILNTSLNKES